MTEPANPPVQPVQPVPSEPPVFAKYPETSAPLDGPVSSAPVPDTDPAPAPSGRDDTSSLRPVVKRTRASSAWVGSVVAALLLILLLVFILQNGTKVPVKFLWLTGHLPLGIALLFAAIGGVLIMAALAGARVLQLRVAARRLERATR